MNDDDALLEELARVLSHRTEPPAALTESAKELLTWRTIDAELAALTYDSLLDEQVTSRGPGQPRILTFEIDAFTVEVEIDATQGRRRLLGQVVPASEVVVTLRVGQVDTASVTADEMGRFVLPLGAEPARSVLRCTLTGGSVVETAAVTL